MHQHEAYIVSAAKQKAGAHQMAHCPTAARVPHATGKPPRALSAPCRIAAVGVAGWGTAATAAVVVTAAAASLSALRRAGGLAAAG
jgi:hypothetical protein